VPECECLFFASVASTIETIAARIAWGRVGQASTTVARSGSVRGSGLVPAP